MNINRILCLKAIALAASASTETIVEPIKTSRPSLEDCNDRQSQQFARACLIIKEARRPVSFGYIRQQLNEPIFETLEQSIALRFRKSKHKGKVYYNG